MSENLSAAEQYEICPECRGDGGGIDKDRHSATFNDWLDCPVCKGSGKRPHTHVFNNMGLDSRLQQARAEFIFGKQ